MTSPLRRNQRQQPKAQPNHQPPAKTPAQSAKVNPSPRRQRLPTVGRRFLAWMLEVGIFAASITVPVALGGKLNTWVENPGVEMTTPVRIAQRTTARILGISPRSLPVKVTPLTNFLWSVAIGLPIVLVSAHLYSMSRHGRSWPKQWLEVQVMTLEGQAPGLQRAVLREAIGKMGAPLLVAYGLWKVSGAFPLIGVLFGLGTLALIGESLTGLGNRPRRPWHDWLAGTCVVDQETGAIIRLTSLWEAEAGISQRSWAGRYGDVTSVVFSPISMDWSTKPSRLGVGLGMLLILGSLAGMGSYFLLGNQSSTVREDEALYRNLVATLTNPELDAAARRAAVLALGNLSDDRVTPLLVDLIAQTEDPLWLDALQQALVARGAEAFPYLQRLNQSLSADLAMQSAPTLHHILIIRLQTVNRVVTKLLMLENSDRPRPLNLSRLNLGYTTGDQGDFRLVLKHQNLAGINWQGSVLTQAQFQGAQFFHPGADAHPDTYDDRTTDLSGADLSDANLTGANLTLSRLVNTGLLRATLNRANLTLANLNGANLEQAKLIQATLDQAQLVEARLSKADLTAAQLAEVNLEAARLAAVNAAGASMPGASLRGAAAQAANLIDVDLSRAVLDNADLTGARLQGANLREASLSHTILRDADLRGVWLQGANLAGADFTGTILAEPTANTTKSFVESVPPLPGGQQFDGVDFSAARNLDPTQLTIICNQGGVHPACSAPTQE